MHSVTSFGDTPGHLAAYRGHSEVLEVLLINGLEPHVANKGGLNILQVAQTRRKYESEQLIAR